MELGSLFPSSPIPSLPPAEFLMEILGGGEMGSSRRMFIAAW